jgi:nicotinamide phosphoribosyltransferase
MNNRIQPKTSLGYNICLDVDSYKLSHWPQYPEGTDYMMSYLEARGGEFEECTLFGLQYLLHEYLSKPVTKEHVVEASNFAGAHGEPFNYDGWMYIVNKYDGCLPVRIRAIPEGTIVPVKNAVLTIECFDKECFWIVSWLETMLTRLWYPSTIATCSRESKKILNYYLQLSSDTPEADIFFKLHDFGGRGVTCLEQSRLGGAAHLLSFMGSDTIEGIRMLNHFYDSPMAGFSIPASEHSTVSSWGRDGEKDFYRHYVKTFLTDRQLPPGIPKLAACVSDTYNIFETVKFWCSPEMREILKASGGTLVIRPDSGEPVETLEKIFDLLEECLGNEVTINYKGYKVLPSYLRVIQGDGIDRPMMGKILQNLVIIGHWSATNIAFGSGGGLLQKVNRDTQKWAFKCSAIRVNGELRRVFKDPITDPGKKSKSGLLDLVKVDGQYQTVEFDHPGQPLANSELVTVFDTGKILYHTTLEDCRKRMAI